MKTKNNILKQHEVILHPNNQLMKSLPNNRIIFDWGIFKDSLSSSIWGIKFMYVPNLVKSIELACTQPDMINYICETIRFYDTQHKTNWYFIKTLIIVVHYRLWPYWRRLIVALLHLNKEMNKNINTRYLLHKIFKRQYIFDGNENEITVNKNLLNSVNFLTKQGFDINSINEMGNGLLSCTYCYHHLSYIGIKFLIDMGVDVNSECSVLHPLHLIFSYVNRANEDEAIRYIKVLINAGANLEIKDNKVNMTPLTRITLCNNISQSARRTKYIKLLIDHGANISNYYDIINQTNENVDLDIKNYYDKVNSNKSQVWKNRMLLHINQDDYLF